MKRRIPTPGLYRKLIEYTADAFYLHDLQGRIIDVNQQACDMLGYTRDELCRMTVFDIEKGYPRKGIEEVWEKLSREGIFVPEGLHQRKDGTFFPVEVNLGMLEHDDTVYIMALARDISARKAMEEALRISEIRFRTLVEQAPFSIQIMTPEGCTLTVNHAYEGLFGATLEDIADYNMLQDQQLVEKGLMSYIERGFRGEATEIPAIEYDPKRTVASAGEKCWVRGFIYPVRDGDRITEVILMHEDVTKQKRAEQKTELLLQQNRSLTQRLFKIQEEERRYLSRELHDEFGQWLTAMHLHTQVIARLTEGTAPEVRSSISTVEECAAQMYKSIHNMARRLRPRTLDELGLRDSLEDLVTQWRLNSPDIHYTFTAIGNIDDLGEMLNITLYRLIQESLTNISKHSQASHAQIKLERRTRKKYIDDIIILTIDDNGQGVDINAIPGGMGLPGMRERVLATGGEFEFDSAIGQGVHIRVQIPITANAS